MPTDLYIQAEREAEAEWLQGPPPKRAELRDVTCIAHQSGRSLPVAVAPRSVWDNMERYFYSVEELWRGAEDGGGDGGEGGPCWWLSWGVGEYKASKFYRSLMRRYGRQ